MQRNFECPATAEACEDSRCKRAVCVIAREANDRRDDVAAAEMARYSKDIERAARNYWKHKGIASPTYDQMQKAMNHPTIIAHAIKFAKPISN